MLLPVPTLCICTICIQQYLSVARSLLVSLDCIPLNVLLANILPSVDFVNHILALQLAVLVQAKNFETRNKSFPCLACKSHICYYPRHVSRMRACCIARRDCATTTAAPRSRGGLRPGLPPFKFRVAMATPNSRALSRPPSQAAGQQQTP